MEDIIVRILRNRITREKAIDKLNVDEMTNTVKIFLAGGVITSEQYGEFKMRITSSTTNTNTTPQVTA
jgi:hypothetical protein